MLETTDTPSGRAPTPLLEAPEPLEHSDQFVMGVFERPSGFVLSAIARHKLTVLIAAIVLAVAGVAIARTRPTTYEAAATLQIGQVNPNSPGFYGYVQSSASLATAFSRSIAAEPVLDSVGKQLKLTPSKAASRLSATPIPQAPAFKVIATGPGEQGTIALANAAASAVIAYEAQSNSANPEAESLLHEYKQASIRLQHANEDVAHLFHSRQHGGHVSKGAIAGAEAERNALAARFRAIGSAYNATFLSQAPRSGLVSLLAGATSASSNRTSKMELYGFIGLLVGAVAGCGLAVLRERLKARRLPIGA